MDVLAKGGHAVDAAIAGVLAVGVAQPVSSGIGGGGFAMVYEAKTGKVTVLDFRETAPKGLRPIDFMKRPAPEKKRGVMTGVPGEIAGLAALAARFGKRAFADDVRPAAELATKGFPVSPHMARALGWSAAWLDKSPRYAFWKPTGALAPAGAVVKNEALGRTLERIAAEGKDAFYKGAIAADILDTARSAGSPMRPTDLERYEPVERAPLHTTWEGHEIYTMPPPSAGGVMLLETLHMWSKADLAALGYGSGAYLHMLAETFRGAIADRVRAVGDPAFVKVDVAALAAPARMKARRAKLSPDATTPGEKFPFPEAGTSHLVTVDAEGNIASITSTVNNMFGAKLVTAGGFVLNDELDDFTPEPIEARYGLRHGPNSPRGGARPTSSMTPTIVLRDGKPVLALGGSGGSRIATGVTQVALATLAFGRTPAEAVAAPRIETPPAGGLLLDGSDPALVADLTKRGEVVDATKPNFSAVQAIGFGAEGGALRLFPAADPRKHGAAAVE
jgi:gamma-glutamyltranspeptidase/glutathione hydrolase